MTPDRSDWKLTVCASKRQVEGEREREEEEHLVIGRTDLLFFRMQVPLPASTWQLTAISNSSSNGKLTPSSDLYRHRTHKMHRQRCGPNTHLQSIKINKSKKNTY